MKNLLTSIFAKASSSNLSTYVGGRVYLDRAPDNATFPYCVFFIVSGVTDNNFAKTGEEVTVQFSLFSASPSGVEISTMWNYLTTLFDECSLTIPPTGTATDTMVWMHRLNTTTFVEDVTTEGAAVTIKHWSVDYEILTRRV